MKSLFLILALVVTLGLVAERADARLSTLIVWLAQEECQVDAGSPGEPASWCDEGAGGDRGDGGGWRPMDKLKYSCFLWVSGGKTPDEVLAQVNRPGMNYEAD